MPDPKSEQILAWRAEFDSKAAEQDVDAFQRKIEALQKIPDFNIDVGAKGTVIKESSKAGTARYRDPASGQFVRKPQPGGTESKATELALAQVASSFVVMDKVVGVLDEILQVTRKHYRTAKSGYRDMSEILRSSSKMADGRIDLTNNWLTRIFTALGKQTEMTREGFGGFVQAVESLGIKEAIEQQMTGMRLTFAEYAGRLQEFSEKSPTGKIISTLRAIGGVGKTAAAKAKQFAGMGKAIGKSVGGVFKKIMPSGFGFGALLSTILDPLINSFKFVLEPLLMPLTLFFQKLAMAFAPLVAKLVPKLNEWLTKLAGKLVPVISKVVALAMDAIGPLGDTLSPLIETFTYLFDEISAAVKEVLPPVISLLQEIWSVTFPLLMDVVKALVPPVKELMFALVKLAGPLTRLLLPITVKITKLIAGGLVLALKALVKVVEWFTSLIPKRFRGKEQRVGKPTEIRLAGAFEERPDRKVSEPKSRVKGMSLDDAYREVLRRERVSDVGKVHGPPTPGSAAYWQQEMKHWKTKALGPLGPGESLWSKAPTPEKPEGYAGPGGPKTEEYWRKRGIEPGASVRLAKDVRDKAADDSLNALHQQTSMQERSLRILNDIRDGLGTSIEQTAASSVAEMLRA